jgi:hypothetical protein
LTNGKAFRILIGWHFTVISKLSDKLGGKKEWKTAAWNETPHYISFHCESRKFWTAGIHHDIWYHFRNSNTFWILWIITYITTWAPQIFFLEKPVSTPLALARQLIRWIESHRTLIKAPFGVAIHLSSSQQGIRMHSISWQPITNCSGATFWFPIEGLASYYLSVTVYTYPQSYLQSLPLAPTLVMPGERRKWIRRSPMIHLSDLRRMMGAVQLDGGASEWVQSKPSSWFQNSDLEKLREWHTRYKRCFP